MKTILKACLPFFLCLASGCSWLAILDTREEPPGLYEELLLQQKQREIEFNQKYIGMSKDDVLKEWGKPRKITFNEPYCIKPDGDCIYSKDRIGADIRFADEEWQYEKVFKSKTQHYAYSTSFYFVEGKVVKVTSG